MIENPTGFYDQIKNMAEELALKLKACSDALKNCITKTDAESTFYTKTNADARFATKIALDTVDGKAVAAIPKTGSRGEMGGYSDLYESVSSVATINGTSRDEIITAGGSSIVVTNGSAGKTWTKIVAITDASMTIKLGDAWAWSNNEVPTVSVNSILVLKWCGSFGIANLVKGA